jgi:hypothetical protein
MTLTEAIATHRELYALAWFVYCYLLWRSVHSRTRVSS